MTNTDILANTRVRIIDVAVRLLKEQGAAAVTTRGVAQEAGVQAPAIYRIFGDKDGLLEAVAEHVMAEFVSIKAAVVDKAEADGADSLLDLRTGWHSQIDFGLRNPSLFRLLSDPARVVNSPAARKGKLVLEARMHRVAVAGHLRVAESRAVDLFQSAGIGVITTILATTPEIRDPGLSEAVLEGVLAQILSTVPDVADTKPITMTIAFRAIVPTLAGLTPSERLLLTEWLDRVIALEPQTSA